MAYTQCSQNNIFVQVRYKKLDPLKVLTNEKKGGLAVVSFDRSGFKLFSLRFSNKSMQAPSCERNKTAQRTLFLLFANNNCFPTSGPQMQGLLETPGLTVAGHLVHGQVKVVPIFRPLTGWGLQKDLSENFSEDSLKGDLSNTVSW